MSVDARIEQALNTTWQGADVSLLRTEEAPDTILLDWAAYQLATEMVEHRQSARGETVMERYAAEFLNMVWGPEAEDEIYAGSDVLLDFRTWQLATEPFWNDPLVYDPEALESPSIGLRRAAGFFPIMLRMLAEGYRV